MNLKDLAEVLGVSQTTISRALNGYPEVSEGTRKRVMEAAARYGYRPDSRARSLATGRSMSIGMVLPMASPQEVVNPIFADFVAGAGGLLVERGYDVLLSLASGATEDEAGAYRSLATRGRVDGVILQAPLIDDWRIGMLQKLGLPFVVHGRTSNETSAYSWIDVDNRRAFRRATDHLLDLGHRRIALLNGLEAMDFAFRRRDGYVTALTARDITPDPALMYQQAMTETYGFATTCRLLDGPNPPSAVLTSSLLVALGVRRALESRGLRMGQDVSLVTHDDGLSYLPNGDDAPMFTSTRSSVRDVGKRASEMLLAMIDDPTLAPLQTQLEAALVLGPSSGPAPHSERTRPC
ncbi:LacI family DNA-binding transcriptional regulator [Pseudoruegeria sp. SK021]|uniref:LacI family DNA-binding transcriptional regulator n=1 Tax=Pseudoruegeria sp. SK021 TaxID=1933035 RepID=UPI000A21757B|nr:substrate-binding domain-containing protein [Pseudoruegeria sp. SK021]OSP56162.1 LacI family transcriptional regulator [Pseudoruegeria sp. SK021]